MKRGGGGDGLEGHDFHAAGFQLVDEIGVGGVGDRLQGRELDVAEDDFHRRLRSGTAAATDTTQPVLGARDDFAARREDDAISRNGHALRAFGAANGLHVDQLANVGRRDIGWRDGERLNGESK